MKSKRYPHEEKDNNLTLYTKINSRWIVDLNVKGTATKLPEKNIREYHQSLRVGKDFLNRTHKKAQTIKGKIES